LEVASTILHPIVSISSKLAHIRMCVSAAKSVVLVFFIN